MKKEVSELCKTISQNDNKQGILGKCSGIDKIMNYFESNKETITYNSHRDIAFIKILYKFYKFSSSIERKLIDYMCNAQVPTPYNTIFLSTNQMYTYEKIIYIVSKTQSKCSQLKHETILPLINEVYMNHVKVLHYICHIFPDDIAHKILCFTYHNDVFDCKIPNL